MQKIIKLLLATALMLLIACVVPMTVSAAEGDVAINETNFPDGTFRGYVKGFDSNSDGILSKAECSNVTYINVEKSNITSLKGVEYFSNLTKLICNGNNLTSLDLSKNTILGVVYCYDNQLTSLNIGANEKMYQISCFNNKLTKLDVSKCPNLQYLYCYVNQIESIDVSKNLKLYDFNAKDKLITSLDVSKNTELHNLCMIRNKITSLDVSNNTKLQYLYMRSNKLTSIDVSKNTILKKIWVDYNQFACLDLSNNTSITEVLTNDNSYTITQTRDNTFDLSTISGFNPALASNWSGGTVSGNILTIDVQGTTVTYTYDLDGMSGSKTANFKFNVANPSKPITYIDSVSVTGVDAPVAGKAFDVATSCNTTGVTEKTPVIVWEKKSGNKYENVTGNADYNTTYKAVITVTPDWYYEFTKDTKGTINGNVAVVSYDAASGKLVLSVEYTTAKEKLQSIEQNNSLQVAANVELKNMGLPASVSIVTDGKKTTSAKVNWNISNPTYLEGTAFDINNKDGYSFILQGTVICPENVDVAGVQLTTKIKVTVAKEGVVVIPTETQETSQASMEESTQETTSEITQETTVEDETEEITTEEITTEASAQEETIAISEEDNVKDGGNNLWWIWLVLVGVIIAFMIFIILKKRDNDEENEKE